MMYDKPQVTPGVIDELLKLGSIYIKGPILDSIVPITVGVCDDASMGYRVGSSYYKAQAVCKLINDGMWQIGTKRELNPKMYKIW